MIYELPCEAFQRAATLFAGAWFDRAFIDAVLDGSQVGRLFVDHPQAPTAALLCRTYEYYVAGATHPALRRFIREAPAEAGIFADLYGYCPLSAEWEQALLADHGEGLLVIPRRGFRYQGTADEVRARRPPLPAVASLARIDRALAEQLDAELTGNCICAFWGGYERFLAGGFGFVVLIDGAAIGSVAYTCGASAREANIGVVTAPGVRRQGLATIVCSQYVEECLARGVVPTWDTDAANAGSLATAHRLGFVEHAPFSQLSPPPGTPLALSHGLWMADPPREDGVVVWQRPPAGRIAAPRP